VYLEVAMRARVLKLHHETAKKLVRLKKEADEEGAYRVSRRIHAVLLNHEEHTSGSIASLLRVPRSRVSEWLRNYEAFGYEGLLEGHRSGRSSYLAEKERQVLEDILDSGPVAYGYTSGVWTSPMIARVIKDEYNVTYHPGHVRRLLHEFGYSVQRPRRKLVRADPAQQDKWHRYTYPNLKKKPPPKARP
jgi:transposase